MFTHIKIPFNLYFYIFKNIFLLLIKSSQIIKFLSYTYIFVFTNFFINKDNINSSKNVKYFLVTTGKNLAINRMKKNSRIIELSDNYTYELNKTDDFFPDWHCTNGCLKQRLLYNFWFLFNYLSIQSKLFKWELMCNFLCNFWKNLCIYTL